MADSIETQGTGIEALVYAELRQLARRARRPYAAYETLNTTGLAHEAYLKLAESAAGSGLSPAHLRALVARCLRQVLVDRARKRYSAKHGARAVAPLASIEAVTLDSDGAPQPFDLLAADQVLNQLATLDPRLAAVVEQHVFGGMSFAEIAGLHGLTERTIFRDWRKARAFLLSRLVV